MEARAMILAVTYPRLPVSTAEALLVEQQDLSVLDLRQHWAASHQKQEWYPTVPTRVNETGLSALRSGIVGIAQVHGFPDRQPRNGNTLFDQQVAVYLYERMGLVPAEASSSGVWSFLSLVLLPDVAVWRFPERHRNRFIGSDVMIGTPNRHVFGRLWARTYVFGSSLIPHLLEDNIEGILGRPTFGGSPRIARAIGNALVCAVAEHGVTNSQNLLRDAMKRLRRLAYLVSFDTLDDDQLRVILGEVFTASVHEI
jgi:hypothetical protein